VRFDVVTLFPELFRVLLDQGVTGRALVRGIAELHLWNPRDYTGTSTAPWMTAPTAADPGW
jgi:tRNA (guanine37-N1)-methyltransferase